MIKMNILKTKSFLKELNINLRRLSIYSNQSSFHSNLIKNNFLEISEEISDSKEPVVALESKNLNFF
jgi:hypothetical protein